MKVILIAETKLNESFGEMLNERHGSRPRKPSQFRGTEAEKLAEYAGRICYDSYGVGRGSEDFSRNIIEHKHFNLLYHINYVMDISGVSRNLTHELVRHHVGFSPTMRSTRYCNESNSKIIHHPEVQRALEDDDVLADELTQFESAMKIAYTTVIDRLVAKGVDRKSAHGAAARYLPNGIETELVWSGNLFAFISMIDRRLDAAADEEFRQLSECMLRILLPKAPKYLSGLMIKYEVKHDL